MNSAAKRLAVDTGAGGAASVKRQLLTLVRLVTTGFFHLQGTHQPEKCPRKRQFFGGQWATGGLGCKKRGQLPKPYWP